MSERVHYEVPVVIYVQASCRDAAYHEVREASVQMLRRLDCKPHLFDIDYSGVAEI